MSVSVPGPSIRDGLPAGEELHDAAFFGLEAGHDPVAERGERGCVQVLADDGRPAAAQRADLGTQQNRLTCPRTGSIPDEPPCPIVRSGVAWIGRPHEFGDVADESPAHEDLACQLLELQHLIATEHRFEGRGLEARRGFEDRHQAVRVGAFDDQVQEEAVELGFRQRERAFELDRVLGRDDVERLRQAVRGLADRHRGLLHRLEERGLRLGRRAIDLVGEHEIREQGPGLEPELQPPLPLFDDPRARDVGRHQVRCELDACEREAQTLGKGLDEARLAEPRHALEEDVTACEQSDGQVLDQTILPKDPGADLATERVDLLGERLGTCLDVQGVGSHGSHRVSVAARCRWGARCDSGMIAACWTGSAVAEATGPASDGRMRGWLLALSIVAASCAGVSPDPAVMEQDLPERPPQSPSEAAVLLESSDEAVARFTAGDREGAVPDARALLALDPADARARAIVAWSRMQAALREASPPPLAAWRAVEGEFRRASRLAPDDPFVIRLHAGFLIADGHLSAAAGMLDDALDRSPDDPELLELGARVHYDRGDEREAIRLLRRVEALRPMDPDPVWRLGQCWTRVAPGEPSAAERTAAHGAAIRAFARYRTLRPDDPDGWLGEAQARLSRAAADGLAEAERDVVLGLYAESARRAPSSAEPAFGIGATHELAGSPAEAQAAYRTALALDPTHVASVLNLAALLAASTEAADRAASLVLLRRALDLGVTADERRRIEDYLAAPTDLPGDGDGS
ncbi:MAG: hypothetical protein RL562_536 [Planctomycetota bacterium]